MSGEKQIKFQFVVDENSARAVNRVLDEMIRKAQQLGKALAGVAGGGILGGGGVGPSASPQSTLAGKGGSLGSSGAGGGTARTSFTQILGGSAEGFKKLATESGSAMKAMTDSLVRATGQQQGAVNKLSKDLEGLAAAYSKLGSNTNNSYSKKLQDMINNKAMEVSKAKEHLGKMREALGGMEPEGPLTGVARGRAWLNSGGGIGAQEVSMANLAKVPGIGPMFSGMGLAGGAATAGVGLIAAAAVKAATTAAVATYNAPALAQVNRVAAMSVGPSSYARKLRGGDLSDIRAMADIQDDPTKNREYSEIEGRGKGFWNWTRRVGIGFKAAGAAYDRGEFMTAIDNALSGRSSIDAQNIIKGKKREYLNNNIEERGVQEDIFRDATANAMGKMATMRALGIGGGYKKTGAYVSGAEAFLNQFSGFDNGEVIGAVQGISGQGTRGAALGRNGLLNSALQAQAAGINGAAAIGGIFSRSGAMDGREMVDLLRSLAGQGTDVSTTSLLGNYLASVQVGANMPGMAGAGALGALAYGAQGDDGAMVARQNIAGMGAFGNLLAGSRDPAQAAMNFAIARRSAPDAGYYAQHYLASGLTPERMADLQAGVFAPNAYERNIGIDEGMLKAQMEGVQKSQAFRVMSKAFGKGNMVGDFAKAMSEGGSLRENTQKVFGESEQAQIEGLASYLKAGGGDQYKDMGVAMGAARLQLFGLGKKTRQGDMAGDVAGGSVESRQAKEEAEIRETDRKLKDTNIKAIEDQVAKEADAYRRLVTNSTNLAITAENITTIISRFAANLKAASGGAVPPATNQKVGPK